MKFEKRKYIKEEEILKVSKETKLDPLIVELMLMREIKAKEDIDKFLKPNLENLSSPLEFAGIINAENLIRSVIENEQAIVIYGDYDCDGIGAIAILYLTLKSMNAKVHYYIPLRHEEGYGLNLEALDKIKNDFDPKLIITVDCGITAVKQVKYAVSLGMDVIVTDHHEPAEILPEAIILNPILNKDNNPLCGAGVALKLCEQLTNRNFAAKLMDICAISTVADVVPLVADNRIIVKYGLEMLTKGNCRIGLKKLIAMSGIKKGKEIKCSDIAFRLAPRLNAAGRLSSAYKSLQLLIEEDTTAIAMLAEEIERENKERQDILVDVLNDALTMLEAYDLSENLIIILKSEKWEEGVIGIAAAKIVEQFCRPAILLSTKNGILKGSARSISGINMFEVLKSCEDILLKFGGHSMAAGMRLKEENFDLFLQRTNEYIKNTSPKECFERKIVYDLLIETAKVDNNFMTNVLMLEPFGCSNPKPVFLSKENKTKFTQIGKHPHIKCRKKSCEIIAFNKLFELETLNSDTEKVLSFYIDKENFNNKVQIQCKLKEIYTEKANIENEILLSKYIENYVLNGESKVQKKSEPISEFGFGTLYVCFSNECFNLFAENNPNIQKFFFNTTILNPYNAIVLSPEKDFIYKYYNKIIFLEKPPTTMLDYIKARFLGIIECIGDEPLFKNVDIHHNCENLRKDYVFFTQKLNGTDFDSPQALYKKAKFYGYVGTFIEFSLSLHIFIELELLIINNNSIIEIYNVKVDIHNSKIVKWFKIREGL